MMRLRRAEDRHHDSDSKQEVWRTFAPPGRGFGVLELLDEDRLGPGEAVLGIAHHDAEVITYVREGALAHGDSSGHSGVIQTGEFHRLTPGPNIRHSVTNASLVEWAHIFRIAIRPREVGLACSLEQKRFYAADRRGLLCVVASADGQRGSLRLQQDALVYSGLLEPGQHVIHELSTGRSAWLHVVQGAVTLGDLVLSRGDGVGFTGDRAVSLTAREASEILLLDLGARVARGAPEVR